MLTGTGGPVQPSRSSTMSGNMTSSMMTGTGSSTFAPTSLTPMFNSTMPGTGTAGPVNPTRSMTMSNSTMPGTGTAGPINPTRSSTMSNSTMPGTGTAGPISQTRSSTMSMSGNTTSSMMPTASGSVSNS